MRYLQRIMHYSVPIGSAVVLNVYASAVCGQALDIRFRCPHIITGTDRIASSQTVVGGTLSCSSPCVPPWGQRPSAKLPGDLRFVGAHDGDESEGSATTDHIRDPFDKFPITVELRVPARGPYGQAWALRTARLKSENPQDRESWFGKVMA